MFHIEIIYHLFIIAVSKGEIRLMAGLSSSIRFKIKESCQMLNSIFFNLFFLQRLTVQHIYGWSFLQVPITFKQRVRGEGSPCWLLLLPMGRTISRGERAYCCAQEVMVVLNPCNLLHEKLSGWVFMGTFQQEKKKQRRLSVQRFYDYSGCYNLHSDGYCWKS